MVYCGEMNTKQRLVIVGGIAAMITAALFPPWKTFLYGEYAKYGEKSVGHHFITWKAAQNQGIDTYQLIGIEAIILLLCFGLLWVFKSR